MRMGCKYGLAWVGRRVGWNFFYFLVVSVESVGVLFEIDARINRECSMLFSATGGIQFKEITTEQNNVYYFWQPKAR